MTGQDAMCDGQGHVIVKCGELGSHKAISVMHMADDPDASRLMIPPHRRRCVAQARLQLETAGGSRAAAMCAAMEAGLAVRCCHSIRQILSLVTPPTAAAARRNAGMRCRRTGMGSIPCPAEIHASMKDAHSTPSPLHPEHYASSTVERTVLLPYCVVDPGPSVTIYLSAPPTLPALAAAIGEAIASATATELSSGVAASDAVEEGRSGIQEGIFGRGAMPQIEGSDGPHPTAPIGDDLDRSWQSMLLEVGALAGDSSACLGIRDPQPTASGSGGPTSRPPIAPGSGAHPPGSGAYPPGSSAYPPGSSAHSEMGCGGDGMQEGRGGDDGGLSGDGAGVAIPSTDELLRSLSAQLAETLLTTADNALDPSRDPLLRDSSIGAARAGELAEMRGREGQRAPPVETGSVQPHLRSISASAPNQIRSADHRPSGTANGMGGSSSDPLTDITSTDLLSGHPSSQPSSLAPSSSSAPASPRSSDLRPNLAELDDLPVNLEGLMQLVRDQPDLQSHIGAAGKARQSDCGHERLFDAGGAAPAGAAHGQPSGVAEGGGEVRVRCVLRLARSPHTL